LVTKTACFFFLKRERENEKPLKKKTSIANLFVMKKFLFISSNFFKIPIVSIVTKRVKAKDYAFMFSTIVWNLELLFYFATFIG
jgi:hypothetical protein